MQIQHIQARSLDLATQAFGQANVQSKEERLLRFLEEALELTQSGGLDRAQAHTLVDYVFARPVETEIWKEIGGSAITLALVAEAFNEDLEDCADSELDRLEVRIPGMPAEHAAKPDNIKAKT